MHDLELAEGLCDLLGSSIEPSTASNYRCGFRSLTKFCKKVQSSPLPVSAATLCLWMFKICGRKRKPATVAKYLSGVRHMHLLNGFDWTLSANPLVQMTLRGLRKRYRSNPKFQKVPLCLGTLLTMCRVMPGWLHLRSCRSTISCSPPLPALRSLPVCAEVNSSLTHEAPAPFCAVKIYRLSPTQESIFLSLMSLSRRIALSLAQLELSPVAPCTYKSFTRPTCLMPIVHGPGPSASMCVTSRPPSNSLTAPLSPGTSWSVTLRVRARRLGSAFSTPRGSQFLFLLPPGARDMFFLLNPLVFHRKRFAPPDAGTRMRARARILSTRRRPSKPPPTRSPCANCA